MVLKLYDFLFDKVRKEIAPETVDFCEAGRFSAFISEKGILYPCSFMNDIENAGDQSSRNHIEKRGGGKGRVFRKLGRDCPALVRSDTRWWRVNYADNMRCAVAGAHYSQLTVAERSERMSDIWKGISERRCEVGTYAS